MSDKPFHVSAGKYDMDQERDCKYCDSFESADDAVAAYNQVKNYPWAEIKHDGETIVG